jgi:hypothetical protein
MLEESTHWTCKGAPIGLAQPRRRLHERNKHRLQIEGRAADDLEHVGGGGLLLQRLSQLVKQAGILDSDDGLLGEIGDQLNLLVGKRSDLLPVDDDGTDHFVVLEHRYCGNGASIGELDQCPVRLGRLRY